jgi:hypothetical protein
VKEGLIKSKRIFTAEAQRTQRKTKQFHRKDAKSAKKGNSLQRQKPKSYFTAEAQRTQRKDGEKGDWLRRCLSHFCQNLFTAEAHWASIRMSEA